MNVQKLASWLRRQPNSSPSITLVYLAVSGEEPVFTWVMSAISPEVARNEANLANDILAAAQEDCENREYQCRYAVRILGDDGAALASTNIKCKPIGSTTPDEVGDASAAGVVSQCLRHNEAMMRMIIGSQSQLNGQYHEIIRIQAEQIKDMRRREKIAAEILEKGDGEPDPTELIKAEAWAKASESFCEHVMPRVANYMDGAPGTEKE